MSTTPAKYQASPRLIDDAIRLEQLYCKRGLTIREIAAEYASVSHTRVHQALKEHGLTQKRTDDNGTSASHGERGVDPPPRPLSTGPADDPSVFFFRLSPLLISTTKPNREVCRRNDSPSSTADTMITDCDAYHALDDDEKQDKAFAKMSADRKARLAQYEGPLHMLKTLGVAVPHRGFHADKTYPKDHTAVCPNGTRVHYCQDVREDFSDAFGSFGAADGDDEEVVWTAFDVGDETVMMKVVGDWKDRRDVPLEEFQRNYEPVTLGVQRGQHYEEVPKWGY